MKYLDFQEQIWLIFPKEFYITQDWFKDRRKAENLTNILFLQFVAQINEVILVIF